MPNRLPTTIRFTEKDREVLVRLCERTGLASIASVIRLALRESLAVREGYPKPKKKKKTVVER
jgi:hypothetical protein